MNSDPFPKPFSCKEKPDISYPCSWLYKVIGTDEDALRQVIQTVCGANNPQVSTSHTSSGGKYCSLNVELQVENEEIRLGYYHNLTNHAVVKVVL
ncbi:MAG: DUF493 domain-containing protein [Proteobacteria bacterium]|nr:DUF493 domain-containing protein [Pseudomonadota bacterium]MBU1455130.1 DUF493 domain-containing protein [Pseudomonadota bacterium]